MKNQWKWVAFLAALALLLGGAYVLYETLGDSYLPGGDIAFPIESESESESESRTSASESESESESRTSASESETAEETEKETEGNPHAIAAPKITFYTYSGTPCTLDDFVGKPVILNFWASWCPPCKAEMPELEEAFRIYGDRVHFIMLNANGGSDAKRTGHAFISEAGYTFPVYYDSDETAYNAFAAYASGYLPATFFIDAKGNLAGRFIGQMSYETIEQGLALILGGDQGGSY